MADNVKVSRVKVESYCRNTGKELEIIVDSVTGPANQPRFTITCLVGEYSSTFSGPTKKYCVELCCAELLKVLPEYNHTKVVDNLNTAHIELLFDAWSIFSEIADLTSKLGSTHVGVTVTSEIVSDTDKDCKFYDYIKTIVKYEKEDPIGFKRTSNSLKSVFADHKYYFDYSKDKISDDERRYHFTISRFNWCDECQDREVCPDHFEFNFNESGAYS